MFNIVEADGMLTFKESPNYEMPADRNKDNVYKVTVVVSDDGAPKLMDERQVEISVTDVEEDGTVTLSAVQPKTGIDLMASLTDPDNVTSTDPDGRIETGVTWQWQRDVSGGGTTATPNCSEVVEDGWEDVPKDGKAATYIPTAGDVGKCLHPVASYTDRRGSGKSAMMPSDNAVIENTDNVGPEFREGGDKPVMQATRNIAENSVSDTLQQMNPGNVGDPVMATDPNISDLLTYTLSGSDAALFKITHDTSTDPTAADGRGGQISLNANTELDYEARTTYMVTVTAADPDGEMASVDVTIKVTDENEAPMIYTGPSIVGPASSYYDEKGMAAVASYQGAALNSPSWSLSGTTPETSASAATACSPSTILRTTRPRQTLTPITFTR